MFRFSLYYFFLFTTFAVLAPHFQLFLAAKGFSKGEVGLLLGCFELAGAIGPIVLGHLGDRLGKRRGALLLAMACSAAMLAPLNWLSGFWPAVPFVVILGFMYKSTIPLGDALACSELPDPEHQYGRARVMGSISFVLALLAISAFGLIDKTSSGSILVCFAVSVALCLPAIALLPDRHRRTVAVGGIGGDGFDRVFWLGIAVIALGRLGMAAHYSFFSLYLCEEIGLSSPGWVWAIGATAEMPLIFFGGRVVRRFGLVAMLAAALVAVSLRLTVYALLPTLAAVMAAQLLHALTFGVFHIAAIEFIRRKVPKRRVALAMAIYMSVGLGAPALLGSSAGGFIIERYGYRMLFLTYAAAPLVGLVCLVAGRKGIARLGKAGTDIQR